MLRWTSAFCRNVTLFKVDDDSFLIPHRFSKWLQQFNEKHPWPTNSIIGEHTVTQYAGRSNREWTIYVCGK